MFNTYTYDNYKTVSYNLENQTLKVRFNSEEQRAEIKDNPIGLYEFNYKNVNKENKLNIDIEKEKIIEEIRKVGLKAVIEDDEKLKIIPKEFKEQLYELAKEYDMSNKDFIEYLEQKLDIKVKSHSAAEWSDIAFPFSSVTL